MKLFLYTDASFSKKYGIGIAGYLMFNSEEDNNCGNIDAAIVKTTVLHENNNNRIELNSIILALQDCMKPENTGRQIQLYTDSKTAAELISRRSRLESRNYLSKNKNRLLGNADLYKFFFALHDKLLPDIRWIKGHSPKNAQDTVQRNFSYIDRLVRKNLRGLILKRD
jgi:ribonuclease HI